MQFLASLVSNSRNFRRRWNRALSLHHFSSNAREASVSNAVFVEFLRDNGFQKPQAMAIAMRYPNLKSLEQPRSVIQMLKSYSFSDTQIQKLFRVHPQMMFYNVEKNLEPKLRFFEELGFSGSDLGKFVSQHSSFIGVSLVRKIIPTVEILKSIVAPKHEHLTVILSRCGWLLGTDPNLFLLPNISYLKTCGIVGSQLASLLRRQPRIFNVPEEKLRGYVSRALELGFNLNSRMLVHAVLSLSSLSEKTFDRKLKLFVANGFSEDEITDIIRRSPGLIRCAEDKLTLGFEFYMKRMGIEREALVKRPCVLMYNLEKRVIPRLKVLQILREKRLLLKEEKKKKKKIFDIVEMTEEAFLEKYVVRFGDEIAEELLVAYKGHLLNNDDDADSSCSSHEDCSLITD
ncbi:Transcription termination factor mitochondrial/chloroplastic [Arabidopsis suecica]|uniref:Transcription termination factor mitochondrial/chloroplastic n=1 Tax=Arabidopsis suecica TaxID=45249 RepID=A0A8T1Y4J4_ARASU|nr:Transcription termination factor mitochondrial/chloroplastic [Arabidopsis suecica]